MTTFCTPPTTNGSASRAMSRPSASPITRSRSSATSCSSSCRKSAAVLKKAEAAAVVEWVKAASDVYAPISGEVLEVNDALVADPR